MKRRDFFFLAVVAALAALSSWALLGWQRDHGEVEDLKAQLAQLQQEVQRAKVVRSMSVQMEQIAYQQKAVSDEQREEAQQQTRVANEMRRRSEEERQNALEAEHKAQAEERKAVNASRLAEERKAQAEERKRVADTLSYIALGRSLGSMASNQHEAGNRQTAAQLAYASWLYTYRYKGDVYYPTVLLSLMQVSEDQHTWAESSGAVGGIAFMPGSSNELVSASNYGELLSHRLADGKLSTTTLVSDKRYDFRKVLVRPDRSVYALSRTGHIVAYKGGDVQEVKLGFNPLLTLVDMADGQLLVVGRDSLATFDTQRLAVTGERRVGYRITYACRADGRPMLFDDKGFMHSVHSLDRIDDRRVPVSGVVTSYASSRNTHTEAYGTADGTIHLFDASGKSQRLLGHRSRISSMLFNGNRLYSASYDGRLNLWKTETEKIEPLPIIENNAWLTSICFDGSKKYIWMGDYSGHIAMTPVSIEEMVNSVRRRITKDMTREEWNYYIGRDIPYEQLK